MCVIQYYTINSIFRIYIFILPNVSIRRLFWGLERISYWRCRLCCSIICGIFWLNLSSTVSDSVCIDKTCGYLMLNKVQAFVDRKRHQIVYIHDYHHLTVLLTSPQTLFHSRTRYPLYRQTVLVETPCLRTTQTESQFGVVIDVGNFKKFAFNIHKRYFKVLCRTRSYRIP
jgi:hypothetical protein